MNSRLPVRLSGYLAICIILSLFVVISGCTAQSANTARASSSASSQVQEGTVTVPGGKVWYRSAGADQPGIPLIVVHGGPGAPHDYLEPLEALADERPVIFYDQLGCGNSACPDDPSLWRIERFVDELEQVRAELAPGEVHILGQSWGTTLVSEYMITRKPAGVRSLIFSAPCLSVHRWEADQRRYLGELPEKERTIICECEETGNFSSEEYQNAMMTYYRLHLCRLEEWPDSMNRTFEKMGEGVYNYMWGPSEFTMTGTLKDFDQSPNLHEITPSVLFTCGRYDEATPESTAYYQSMLPGSELMIFDDASHMHHIEKTDEYLLAVRDFLRRSEENQSRS